MQIQTIDLMTGSPGTRQSFQVHRYGTPGASPKVYIQGALHADEVPAILVTQQLARQFAKLEAEGRIHGEIVLVPYANPIGLGQTVLGQHHGRFDLRDGGNFNRGYAELATAVRDAVLARLGSDQDDNTAKIRQALRDAVAALPANTPTQDLKNKLLALAIDADIVLDLHCDTDAVMHLYALTPQSAMAEQLGAAVGARAVLLATESGDSPFDEACTRPWLQLQQMLPQFPIALACFGATVELRGEADTSHTLARQDALGLCAFLALRQVLSLAVPTEYAPLCAPTPLSGSEPIAAPHAGVVVFHRGPGERVAAGDAIADVVDALTGEVTTVRCKSDGLLYARCGSRWAAPGKRLAKIAGTSLARTGKLLSP
jgi:predicted deacylase